VLGELFGLSSELGPRLNAELGGILADEVRGAILEYDDYWSDWTLVWAYHHGYPQPLYIWDDPAWRHRFFDRGVVKHLLESRPPEWDARCKRMGYPKDAAPIVIRMILRYPATSPLENRELPTQFEQYPIVYEFRPRCRALSGGLLEGLLRQLGANRPKDPTPISVGRANPSTAGTLGGVLRGARTGDHYIVSCAHVLGGVGTATFTPGPYEGHQSREIGVVEYSQLADLKGPSQPCNSLRSSGAGQLDVAIARITDGSDALQRIGFVPTAAKVRPIADMQQNDAVFFVGKVSKRVDAQIEGVVIWFEIEYHDGPRCFASGFSLKPRAPRYLYGQLAQPGDSGAWVLAEDAAGLCWTGVLIGSDDAHAYGCFAETILDASTAQIPGGLLLP
jgi:hypothetical protein